MRSRVCAAIPMAIGLALTGLAGCEDNEASVKGGGTTPPGAMTTSDDAAKVQIPPSEPPAGYGPAMSRPRPAGSSKSKAAPKQAEAPPQKQ